MFKIALAKWQLDLQPKAYPALVTLFPVGYAQRPFENITLLQIDLVSYNSC